MGKEVCFEIFDSYFYALSNVRHIMQPLEDWDDFYTLIRFPVSDPISELLQMLPQWNAYRRHPRDGTTDDRWNFLQLVQDESSGELLIVETRKEYTSGSSQPRRACYIKAVVFEEQQEGDQAQSSAVSDNEVHCHVPSSPAHIGDDGSQGTMFTIQDCFVRFYSASCKSFIDLVNVTEDRWLEPQRLRLRVRAKRDDMEHASTADEATFWPPKQSRDRPNELLDSLYRIINPGGLPGLECAVDERTLVYAPGNHGTIGRPRPVILISFDPSLRLPGYTRMRVGEGAEADVTLSPGLQPSDNDKRSWNDDSNATDANIPPWMHVWPAMYSNIPRSYNDHLGFDMTS